MPATSTSSITGGLLAVALGLAVASGAVAAGLPRTPRPADAVVYIISPADGAVVQGKVRVQFGLRGLGVAPAGSTGAAAEGTGHHHLLVDAPLPAMDQPLPKDAQHIHFGKGQTETELTLAPGKHTLQLVFADANHIPHAPPLVSKPVHVTVH
jgi:hypothetical protein